MIVADCDHYVSLPIFFLATRQLKLFDRFTHFFLRSTQNALTYIVQLLKLSFHTPLGVKISLNHQNLTICLMAVSEQEADFHLLSRYSKSDKHSSYTMVPAHCGFYSLSLSPRVSYPVFLFWGQIYKNSPSRTSVICRPISMKFDMQNSESRGKCSSVL
jgi:hypothetical protein